MNADVETVNSGKISTILKTTYNYFYDFSTNTSIHGFHHLVERRRCSIERLWWLSVLSVCIYTCGSLIALTLKKWEQKPVFVSFKDTPTYLWDIPMPAVTICPQNQVLKDKYNFTSYLYRHVLENNLSDEERQNYYDISMICSFTRQPSGSKHHIMNVESIDFILKNGPRVWDTIRSCEIKLKDCLVSPVLTDTGVCFSINMLDRSDLFTENIYLPSNHVEHSNISGWDPDDNYIKSVQETFPIRFTATSDSLILTILNPELHIDKNCDLYQGFKVILHHPAEVPTMIDNYIDMTFGDHYEILIKPDVTVTSTDLRHYEPHKRGCFHAKERSLRYFKIYTEANCRLECLANFTLQECGCVSYYMPHNGTTTICGLKHIDCVWNIKERLLEFDIEVELFKNDQHENPSVLQLCDCLPSCTSIVYNTEFKVATKSFYSVTSNESAGVVISFKDKKIIAMERNELFSNIDFWASCGGLLGLFTGFSVVSLAEIIYFLSLRWMCNLWSLCFCKKQN